MKKILVILLCSLASMAFSQTASIEAKLDTSDIKIGEQTKLSLKATVTKNQSVLLPAPKDSLAFALEVIKRSTIDSTVQGNQKVYEQALTITSFDSGYHAIPPLPFTVIGEQGNKDSVYSKAILLGVHTVAVDTTQAIKDIKAPKQAPLSFAEIWPYLLTALLVLVLGFIAYRYWQKQKNKPKEAKVAPAKPREPAHIIALRDLEKLKEDKVWQSGAHKEYYSRLTEIVRTYIEYRFQIPALEQTSDEIISALKLQGEMDTETVQKMALCFSNADLVKFAKMHPLPEDNERDMRSAFYFVEHTKPQPQPSTNEGLNSENAEKTIENKE